MGLLLAGSFPLKGLLLPINSLSGAPLIARLMPVNSLSGAPLVGWLVPVNSLPAALLLQCTALLTDPLAS